MVSNLGGRPLKGGQRRRFAQAKIPVRLYQVFYDEAGRRHVPLCDLGGALALRGLNLERARLGASEVPLPHYLSQAAAAPAEAPGPDQGVLDESLVSPQVPLAAASGGPRQRKVLQVKLPIPLYDLVVEEARVRSVTVSDVSAWLALRGLNADRAQTGGVQVAVPAYLTHVAPAWADQTLFAEVLLAG